jgi:C4-dicarboxylate transporter, DctM subunit
MTNVTIAVLSIVALFGLVISGVHIGFALLVTSLIAMIFITGNVDIAQDLLAATAYSGVRDYVFAVVPLFILMGAFMTNCRAAESLFAAVNFFFKKLRGGLAIATVYANAIFAAVTGVSVASAAVFSTIAYPQMTKYGYSKRLALGSVAGSSVLGMLIPPSLLMILYGILTQVSIGAMFIAGIVPGILLALLYSIGIMVIGYLRPESVGVSAKRSTQTAPALVGGVVEKIAGEAPASIVGRHGPDTGSASAPSEHPQAGAGGPADGDALATEVVVSDDDLLAPEELTFSRAVVGSIPIGALIVLVIGGIWGGVFSPTEASAVGAIGALAIAPFMGMDWTRFFSSFRQTAISTGAILFLLIAAQAYSRMLASSGLVARVGRFINGLEVSEIVIIILFVLILVAMGAVLDSSSIILLAVPLMFPSILLLGADPVWFGIVLIVAVEIGLLTPPFGMVPFAMSAVLGDRADVDDIFLGSMPFLVIMVIFLAIIIAFPGLSTWLPGLL